MGELTYREAYGVLANFASSFAAPVVAILPVLEKVRDAEDYLATLEPKLADAQAQLALLQDQAQQATRDKQTILDSIEHDREVKQADADRDLAARQARVQEQIDALYADLTARQGAVAAELVTLELQLEARRDEQRQLDAAIQQKRVVFAEISGQLHAASEKLGG